MVHLDINTGCVLWLIQQKHHYVLTCDPHQIRESWQGTDLELIIVDPPPRKAA